MISLASHEYGKDPLLRALGELGEGSIFLWKIFFISIVPTLLSGMQAISYVFTAEIPTHWCEVEELSACNWTRNQIKTISSASSCTSYNYNYTYFVEIGYDGALNYTKYHKLPETSECSNYLFANNLDRKSIVEEWGPICGNAHQRPTVQMVLILGKTIGAVLFGTLSDKFGRRTVFIIGVILLSISGPLSAFVVKNIAFGSSVTILNLGSLLAPLIVNMLGDKAWRAPNTLCARFVLFAGFLSLKLPETKDRKLSDTVAEEL
ncbi:organic cation transporter protein-like [Belonocnema kinseyi]|uniref:organic cation transporter protein-like n=1 Tax=Belonocnema kinseyi TaxID=2817044 RepID=UPI00143DC108|nr:organic cation transporter protein-like [Belonocnema kinseyi]